MTRLELVRDGYAQKTQSAVCKGCSADIEWWKTPKGKSIPMDPMPDERSRAVAHWTTCPNRKQFKGADTSQPAPAEKPSTLGPSVQAELQHIRRRHNARVVVLVDECGCFAVWQDGIPAEDLRHDLISAANFVRNEIAKKDVTA
jgi:hypothetical protein